MGAYGTILQSDPFYTGKVDFDGDGGADILWRNTSDGRNAVWYMNGTTYMGGDFFPTIADQDCKIAGGQENYLPFWP